MTERRRFRGVYPVLYALFDAAGQLDRNAMAAQVEHCVAAGAHGVMVLGLVTEVHKMDEAGRRGVVSMVGELVAGRVPYAVTIGEPDIDGQVAFAKFARAQGADWVILQPPPGIGHTESDLARHFGAVADRLDMPVAIQNNPVNLASAMSADGLVTLLRAHPNIRLLKAEGWSVDIARVIAALNGEVDAFGGHGGLEFVSLIESGGAGLIPAPDCLALQVFMFEALTSGDPARVAQARAVHKEILPLVVFMTRSIPGLLCYGKRLMARRLGLAEVHDLQPALTPSAFGLAQMARLLGDIQAAERRYLWPGG
ncbi:MAG: dihydrodipicolinate synthase family protein [Alsobacter sp.]